MTRRRSPRHEVSAGGIVVRREGDRTLFLVIRDPYRHWGFPKGHLERDELPASAALREVAEETGLEGLSIRAPIDTIAWDFRFRGRAVHKTCHFFLMETSHRRTSPQRAEGITACRWATYDQAARLISYPNARAVLAKALEMLESGAPGPDRAPTATAPEADAPGRGQSPAVAATPR